MPRVSVIGIGSPFGDDQAGWYVAELLAKSSRVIANAEHIVVTACRSPTSELPDLLAAADIAILVDAVLNSGAPGTVYRLSSPCLPSFASGRLSSHGVGLQAMLELAKTLEDFPSALVIYGIEAESVEAISTMSQSVLRAISRVTEEIERDVAHYCKNLIPKT